MKKFRTWYDTRIEEVEVIRETERTAATQKIIDECVTKERHRYADLQQVCDGQANRIAELEDKCASQKKEIRDLQEKDCKWFQDSITSHLGWLKQNEKQRAALKKLGEKVMVRGKALVEERAHCYLNLERNADIVPWDLNEVSENEQKRLRYDAREQLRAEGKL